MYKILFACYSSAEIGTVGPVALRLRSLSHETAFLVRFSPTPDFPDVYGLSFRYRNLESDVGRSVTSEECHEMLRLLLSPTLGAEMGERLASVISLTHKGLRAIFPLVVNEWVPRWRHFIESALAAWPPNIVVLSAGQVESPVVRCFCEASGIPCIYLLTPFYEFKTVEKLALISEFKTKDEYLVAGRSGVARLLKQAVPRENITVVGSPLFDSAIQIERKQKSDSSFAILFTHQPLAENVQLRRRLIRFVVEHRDVKLLIRPHPRSSFEERCALQNDIDAYQLSGSVLFSKEGSHINDDLCDASVVVTISSITLCDSLLAGIPVICWSTGFLPAEIPFPENDMFRTVRTYYELVVALNDVRESRNYSQHDTGHIQFQSAGSCLASDRIATRVLERLSDDRKCPCSVVDRAAPRNDTA